jgi:hypothetical protein
MPYVRSSAGRPDPHCLSIPAESLLSFAGWSRAQARVVIRGVIPSDYSSYARDAGIPRLTAVQFSNRRRTAPAVLRYPFKVA